ncbi:putative metallophosphoesterase YhaO [bacterium YEK0313]|nr:putative metallophosphoesterase YhaO [bacterium YEK0313]
MFRFIHTADIHLDSPLRSLALRDPDLAELIGNATRRAFVRTIDLCLEERVDALLIAGDLYDGDQTSMKTARFLADQLHRLHAAGIRSFIIRGNHDAVSRITRELVFPDSVKVFGARAEMVVLDRAAGLRPVAVHGLSFAQPHAPESLVGRYRPAADGAINIGLLHTSLGGAPGHDRYAPCSLADLQATGFDYWALGHVHKRAVAEGGGAVVMPGMPQGRDINEAGAKSVTLVAIDDNRVVHVEERQTSIAQFERVAVDVAGLEDWRDLVGAITRRLDRERQAARSEQLVTRLTLTGTTPLAWRIRRDLDLLKTEADQRAAAIGACWVEKLEVACEPPARTTQSSADPLAELHRLMTDEILASDSFQAELAAMAEELRAQLPAECRDVLGLDEAAFRNTLARLAGEGAESVMARLEAADGSA